MGDAARAMSGSGPLGQCNARTFTCCSRCCACSTCHPRASQMVLSATPGRVHHQHEGNVGRRLRCSSDAPSSMSQHRRHGGDDEVAAAGELAAERLGVIQPSSQLHNCRIPNRIPKPAAVLERRHQQQTSPGLSFVVTHCGARRCADRSRDEPHFYSSLGLVHQLL